MGYESFFVMIFSFNLLMYFVTSVRVARNLICTILHRLKVDKKKVSAYYANFYNYY